MEQGRKACIHQKHADVVNLRLLGRQGRTDLAAGHDEFLKVVAHKDVGLLLFHQDAVCTVNFEIIRQRYSSVALDFNLVFPHGKDGSRDPFLLKHQPAWISIFQIQIPDLAGNLLLVL